MQTPLVHFYTYIMNREFIIIGQGAAVIVSYSGYEVPTLYWDEWEKSRTPVLSSGVATG